MSYNLPIKQNELKDTYKLLQPFIHKTPVITSRLLNELAQADLFFKCESLQRTGSFKIRGATSAVLALSEEQSMGTRPRRILVQVSRVSKIPYPQQSRICLLHHQEDFRLSKGSIPRSYEKQNTGLPVRHMR